MHVKNIERIERPLHWKWKATYRRGEEAIYVSTNGWASERALVTKSDAGVWLIDHALWHSIRSPGEAEEWLAALL